MLLQEHEIELPPDFVLGSLSSKATSKCNTVLTKAEDIGGVIALLLLLLLLLVWENHSEYHRGAARPTVEARIITDDTGTGTGTGWRCGGG